MNVGDVTSLDILVSVIASGAAYKGIKPMVNPVLARSIVQVLEALNRRIAPWAGDVPWQSIVSAVVGVGTLVTWWW